MDINEKDRPLYYIDSSFAPELGQDFQDWNNVSDFLPDVSEWAWDQLDYHIRRSIRISKISKDKQIKILSALKTARKYHATCINESTIHTVVTHLYVCELLLQILSMIGGNDWSFSHWYVTPSADIRNIFKLPIQIKKTGLSQNIHSLFFTSELKHSGISITLKDYLMFCPELRKFMFENEKIIPKVFSCTENYSATGAHTNPEKNYHVVNFNGVEYSALHGSGWRSSDQLHKKNFPELKDYNISANKFANFSVEDEPFAEKFISTTRDPQGKIFALAFGESKVQKQRDIEIRFAIIFTLGSLGRYRPWIWDTMEDKNPEQYFAIKKFLEYNHILFPYLILGYLSGKYFTFDKKNIWW